MRTSGPLGLSTFLPSPDRALGSLAGKLPSLPFGLSFPGAGSASPGDELTVVPHLPLVDKWENGAFALRDVMGATGERNVRRWTLSLLQRYRYVIGECSLPHRIPRLGSLLSRNVLTRLQRLLPQFLSACSPRARRRACSHASTGTRRPRCSVSTTMSLAATQRSQRPSASGRTSTGARGQSGRSHSSEPRRSRYCTIMTRARPSCRVRRRVSWGGGRRALLGCLCGTFDLCAVCVRCSIYSGVD